MKTKKGYFIVGAIAISCLIAVIIASFAIWNAGETIRKIFQPEAIPDYPGYYAYQYTRPVVIANKSGHKAEVELWIGEEIKKFVLEPNQSKHFQMKAGKPYIFVQKTESPRDSFSTNFDIEGDILTEWILYKEGYHVFHTLHVSPATVEQIYLKDKLYYFKLSDIWFIKTTTWQTVHTDIEFGHPFGIPQPNIVGFKIGEPQEIFIDGKSYQLEFRKVIKRADCKNSIQIDILKTPFGKDDYLFDFKVH